MKENPRVTLVVVPRERFGYAIESLQATLQRTDYPFAMVYVDCNSPGAVRQQLEREVSRRGVTYLRFDRYLSPNEARNVGLDHVTTQYVVFMDNDVVVERGWLEHLVRCADETGAWAVGPLYLEGGEHNARIHMAGGTAGIHSEGGKRYLREQHSLGHQARSALPEEFQRQPTELVEFHCVLVRTDALRGLGGLDARLLSLHEHIDMAMAIRRAGGQVYFEPRAVVRYSFDGPLRASDLPYLALRWSDDWNRRTLDVFKAKWDLADDDQSYAKAMSWGRNHRRMLLRAYLPPRLRRMPGSWRAVDLMDKVAGRIGQARSGSDGGVRRR